MTSLLDQPTEAALGVVDETIAERDRLKRALADCLRLVETGKPAPGVRIREWRQLAGVPYVDGLTTTERRDQGIARAASRWTDEETAAVDTAIATVARKVLAAYRRRTRSGRPTSEDDAPTFTADNVWRELGPEFPVTKGLAGRLFAAEHAGIIKATDALTFADRGGDHDHSQRLVVWQAVG